MSSEDRSDTRDKCAVCGGYIDESGRCTQCGAIGARADRDMVHSLKEKEGATAVASFDIFADEAESSGSELEPIVRWLSGSSDEFLHEELIRQDDEAAGAPEQNPVQSHQEEKSGEISAPEGDEVKELRSKLAEAERTINSLRTEIRAIETVSVMGSGEIESKVKELVRAQADYEMKLKEAEKTVSDLRNEIKFRDEKFRELEEKLRFKEEEINRHEIDLQHREELMKEELRKIEIRKQEMGSMKELELKKALENLTEQIKEKEEKLRASEKYLAQKENEIRLRENALIGKEIVAFEELAVSELKQEKVKSGTPRLDDLLLGGIPVGSQIIIYGPSFVGKEIAINAFAAEGLRKGVPLIWVTTDKTIAEIREEMSLVINSYAEYEKLGLVFYIDAYSRAIGDTSIVENAAYLENSSDIETINTMVEERLKSIGDIVEKKSYRLVFRSVSSLSASYDVRSIFRLLRPFVAKRKKDRCVGMYSIEKGIMSDQDVQIVSSVMDGVMEFMTDGQNNFISIQGICETQTREKIKYTASKRSLTIGSFTLGHIK
ncbi:MAG: hypothetical protein J9259_05580 [Thermoplasmata archaeon YP2-bin.285]|uniref:KaiC-like domain-containing protein n=1 Tax=Candidatus Sysuiplasma superficiale TaxID=2823368 RepID=A0A8J7YSK9_9ARCH|nr:hypothetical protein [Candidatus Sysuiplasma superficiale]